MTFDPTIGRRIAPAWSAAVHHLADGQWCGRRDVIDAMLAASDLKVSTCSSVLRYAVRDGLLDQAGEWRRGEDRRQLRTLTPPTREPGGDSGQEVAG